MKTINDLRETLFDTIEKLKEGKIKTQDAKTIGELCQTIVNSAKAETEFINKYGGDGTGFIPMKSEPPIKQIARPEKPVRKKEEGPYEFARNPF